jgi:hypothetical protein
MIRWFANNEIAVTFFAVSILLAGILTSSLTRTKRSHVCQSYFPQCRVGVTVAIHCSIDSVDQGGLATDAGFFASLNT